ncbi:MAG: transcription antitermination factor NusB [Rhodospirillaceae bacterium]|jgi:transcription antitermination protein NusB|nr:transcription antitermination factor NusB [Rhodospirillaceae bacterium]MBT6205014.1 transcription antitermination factor NusB [Rhodospirillaceae bacterium]MBT6511672.1 transcription antitermination factor NusB [Rhodospirillaceae bacterium]MBT7613284.1 transcription antitermination factor NusB [Rhodospirillaceae bacterium]
MSSDEERETWQRAKASRLAAVQALYQIDRDAASLEIALSSAVSRGAVLDEQGLAAEIDRVFTTSIVRNVAGDRELRLDGMIDGALAEGWSIARLESLMRAILRAGIHELLDFPDTPVRVIISDYVDIAHAFYDRGEPGMVNAVLDRLARLLRAQEFQPETAAGG